MLGVPDVANHPLAFVTVIVSAIVLAFSYIRMRQLSHVNPMTFITVINGVSFPLALLASFVMGGTAAWAHVPDAYWGTMSIVLAYQALLVALSHILWQRLLARNEVARVTCFTLLTPVVAIITGLLIFGTEPSWQLFTGAALIVAGLGVVVIRRVQMKRNEIIVE
jgi:O-acetylserine/cysteine efflux transporter